MDRIQQTEKIQKRVPIYKLQFILKFKIQYQRSIKYYYKNITPKQFKR